MHDIGPLIFSGYHGKGSTFDPSHVKTLLLVGTSAGELCRSPLGEIIVLKRYASLTLACRCLYVPPTGHDPPSATAPAEFIHGQSHNATRRQCPLFSFLCNPFADPETIIL